MDRLGRAMEAAEEEVDAAMARTQEVQRSLMRQKEFEASGARMIQHHCMCAQKSCSKVKHARCVQKVKRSCQHTKFAEGTRGMEMYLSTCSMHENIQAVHTILIKHPWACDITILHTQHEWRHLQTLCACTHARTPPTHTQVRTWMGGTNKLYAHTHACAHPPHTHTHMHAPTNMHAHTCTHTHITTRTYMHARTHMHTCTRAHAHPDASGG